MQNGNQQTGKLKSGTFIYIDGMPDVSLIPVSVLLAGLKINLSAKCPASLSRKIRKSL